jgi:hypothetical protein
MVSEGEIEIQILLRLCQSMTECCEKDPDSIADFGKMTNFKVFGDAKKYERFKVPG